MSLFFLPVSQLSHAAGHWAELRPAGGLFRSTPSWGLFLCWQIIGWIVSEALQVFNKCRRGSSWSHTGPSTLWAAAFSLFFSSLSLILLFSFLLSICHKVKSLSLPFPPSGSFSLPLCACTSSFKPFFLSISSFSSPFFALSVTEFLLP